MEGTLRRSEHSGAVRMIIETIFHPVMPAKAGIHDKQTLRPTAAVDSGLRRNDGWISVLE